MSKPTKLFSFLFLCILLASCGSEKKESKEEQIRATLSDEPETQDTVNSIGAMSRSQIATQPNSVIPTGMPDHRLVTVYKKRASDANRRPEKFDYYTSSSGDGYENSEGEHFMPGIDILFGYNLLNIAHYDLKLEKLNFLFRNPVLVKTLYYPSFVPDTLYGQPINRDYYLVSVYDEDTNKDTLINKWDLRRFYHFDAGNNSRTMLVPADYSVIRSQYDPKNDVMYLFAKHDADKNGMVDKKEPMHVFWVKLAAPGVAKRMY